MRYVLVDLDGASRDYFATRGAVHDALCEIELEGEGAAAELYVVTYDDDGSKQGQPERGDELLARGEVVTVGALDWSKSDSGERASSPRSRRPR